MGHRFPGDRPSERAVDQAPHRWRGIRDWEEWHPESLHTASQGGIVRARDDRGERVGTMLFERLENAEASFGVTVKLGIDGHEAQARCLAYELNCRVQGVHGAHASE